MTNSKTSRPPLTARQTLNLSILTLVVGTVFVLVYVGADALTEDREGARSTDMYRVCWTRVLRSYPNADLDGSSTYSVDRGDRLTVSGLAKTGAGRPFGYTCAIQNGRVITFETTL